MPDLIVRKHHCYTAIANTNTNDGRGTSYPLGFYATSALAEAAGKGNGTFGTSIPAKAVTVDVVVPGGDWDKAYVPKLDWVRGDLTTVGIPYKR